MLSLSGDAGWKALTALISFGTLVIAIQQWHLSQNKLKLDLFEKRFRIVQALRIFLSKASQNGIGDSDLDEYRMAIFEAQFLFDKDMYEYLITIWERGIDLRALKLVPTNEKSAEQWVEHMRHFSNELKSVGNRFEPYMALGKAGTSRIE